jgi:Ca2+/Na+ antiporter
MVEVFPSPDGMTAIPLLFLILVYGYILFKASKIISNGSEMLLLLYGPGLIGGFVIPIMGAVPDGMIILLSGLGDRDQVKEQIAVGVGTLAGSTIMLLTLPWAIGVYLGRRDIDKETGSCSKNKYSGKLSLFETGVTAFSEIPFMAKTMMVTTLLYLIIQIPAFIFQGNPDAFKKESGFALAGLIVSVLTFLAYSIYQIVDSRTAELAEQKHREAIREAWKKEVAEKFRTDRNIKRVFEQYDTDKNGLMDRKELAEALAGLGLSADRKEVGAMMAQIDTGGDQKVSFEEFEAFIAKIIGVSGSVHKITSTKGDLIDEEKASINEPLQDQADKWGDDVEEEEEEEENFHELTDTQLRLKALFLLIFGTAVVAIFSGNFFTLFKFREF